VPFKKGVRLPGQGGYRANAGRKKKDVEAAKKLAQDVLLSYLEAGILPVAKTYFQLAYGRLVNKYHAGKVCGEEFEADAATTRHYIEQILGRQSQKTQRPVAVKIVVEGSGKVAARFDGGTEDPRDSGTILVGGD
jgi:hypothetical protein